MHAFHEFLFKCEIQTAPFFRIPRAANSYVDRKNKNLLRILRNRKELVKTELLMIRFAPLSGLPRLPNCFLCDPMRLEFRCTTSLKNFDLLEVCSPERGSPLKVQFSSESVSPCQVLDPGRASLRFEAVKPWRPGP